MATPKLPSTGDGTSMTPDPVSTVYLMRSPLHNFAGDKKLYKAWRKRAQQEKVDDIKANLEGLPAQAVKSCTTTTELLQTLDRLYIPQYTDDQIIHNLIKLTPNGDTLEYFSTLWTGFGSTSLDEREQNRQIYLIFMNNGKVDGILKLRLEHKFGEPGKDSPSPLELYVYLQEYVGKQHQDSQRKSINQQVTTTPAKSSYSTFSNVQSPSTFTSSHSNTTGYNPRVISSVSAHSLNTRGYNPRRFSSDSAHSSNRYNSKPVFSMKDEKNVKRCFTCGSSSHFFKNCHLNGQRFL